MKSYSMNPNTKFMEFQDKEIPWEKAADIIIDDLNDYRTTVDESKIPSLFRPPYSKHADNTYERDILEPHVQKLSRIGKSRRTVFDRLTDTAYFTGLHKERFDEFGNGRGLAGREYIYLHDGLTESPSRTHEVFSSVYKLPRKPVVTPGTLGIQRFGIQVAQPKLMWLFRNGDKHHNGLPYFLKSHIKNINVLIYEITKKITPINGPIRKLYDQNFKQVTTIEEIVDGAKYLCSSGEPPASKDRLEKFLNHWIVQKSESQIPSQFYML